MNQDRSGEIRRSFDLNVDGDTAIMQNQIVTFKQKQKTNIRECNKKQEDLKASPKCDRG